MLSFAPTGRGRVTNLPHGQAEMPALQGRTARLEARRPVRCARGKLRERRRHGNGTAIRRWTRPRRAGADARGFPPLAGTATVFGAFRTARSRPGIATGRRTAQQQQGHPPMNPPEAGKPRNDSRGQETRSCPTCRRTAGGIAFRAFGQARTRGGWLAFPSVCARLTRRW
jgi:hypothetical protein